MKKTIIAISFALIIALFTTACRKAQELPESKTSDIQNEEIQKNILSDFATKVALATYQDLENKMNVFYTSCNTFNDSLTQQNLNNAREAWKSARGAWEQSEAFLFGPVSTNNIDPSTDTWPVDYNSLDSLLQTSSAFTQSYLNSLGDELKGYHPSEYLLWGVNGSKAASSFTLREREYLIALAADLQLKATSLRTSWDPNVSNNYLDHIVKAGQGSTIYTTQKAVFEELVNAMAGICDEVANGKIAEPLASQDPSLEESPYSNNSLNDFKNNILGVQNVYFGKYINDGYGISDFLEKNNLSLNNTIVTNISNALSAFDAITVPFGQAIITQPTQVQNLISKINTLKESIEEQLLPFMQQNIVN